jgi:hypothetical protein
VDQEMGRLLQATEMDVTAYGVITLGLHHEQQHQELLYTDIKYILGHNPLLPPYHHQEVLITSILLPTAF